MQGFMSKWICPNQNDFVKERRISDNTFIASLLMSYIHKPKAAKKRGCAFKMDIQKAYNKISWIFIESVMNSMNFHEVWSE